MFDKDVFLHAYVDGEEVKVDYNGDEYSVIILINLMLKAIAEERGATYEDFVQYVFSEGVLLNEFINNNEIDIEKEFNYGK